MADIEQELPSGCKIYVVLKCVMRQAIETQQNVNLELMMLPDVDLSSLPGRAPYHHPAPGAAAIRRLRCALHHTSADGYGRTERL